jgi:hypothetical protein
MFKVGDIVGPLRPWGGEWEAEIIKIQPHGKVVVRITRGMENSNIIKVGRTFTDEPIESLKLIKVITRGHPLTKLFK